MMSPVRHGEACPGPRPAVAVAWCGCRDPVVGKSPGPLLSRCWTTAQQRAGPVRAAWARWTVLARRLLGGCRHDSNDETTGPSVGPALDNVEGDTG